jgi:hypothetical protein
MKSSKETERLINAFHVTTSVDLDQKVRSAMLARIEQTKPSPAAPQPDIWRTLTMKTVKFATAAALLIAAILFIQNLSAPSLLAIEQTARAIGKLETLHLSGAHLDENGVMSDLEIWTRAHSQDATRSGDFREEVKGTRISVVSEKDNTTWRYFPKKNEVQIMTGIQNSIKPFWPDGNFFLELKAGAQKWHEVSGRDKNGQECIIVTCCYELARLPDRKFDFWIQFDAVTMLPTRLTIRDISKTARPQEYQFDKIEFNQPLPDGIFEFQMPQDANIIDKRNS